MFMRASVGLCFLPFGNRERHCALPMQEYHNQRLDYWQIYMATDLRT
jgi:hypothetical protein